MTELRRELDRDIRAVTVLQLRLVATDINQIRGGLIQKGVLPELERRLQQWQDVVVQAARSMEEEGCG